MSAISPPTAVEPDSTARILGTDPWMRFDMWSNRAWEASERAIKMATDIGSSMNSDDGLDARVVSLLHASEMAKEFSEMVNPLSAISGVRIIGGDTVSGRPEVTISVVDAPDDWTDP